MVSASNGGRSTVTGSGKSDAYPITFTGVGCHNDPAIALCRALIEAAQNRLTAISGARDDLP